MNEENMTKEKFNPMKLREKYSLGSLNKTNNFSVIIFYMVRYLLSVAISVLAGSPGVGKSLATTSLAIAGATGDDWFG